MSHPFVMFYSLKIFFILLYSEGKNHNTSWLKWRDRIKKLRSEMKNSKSFILWELLFKNMV